MGTIGGNLCLDTRCNYYDQNYEWRKAIDFCMKKDGSTCWVATSSPKCLAVSSTDTAPALIALDASFRIAGPSGERTVPAADFFTLPAANPLHENVLKDGEVLAAITVPAASASTRSTYHKVMDREAWTHAVVSAAIALEMNGDVCQRARIVLGGVAPIPWRLPEVERMLAGQRITPELAARAGEAAVAGARPLAKNGYKVPLTRAVVKRTLESLGRSG